MITIREATEADALTISRIFTLSWRQAYAGVIQDAYLKRLPEDYWLPTLRGWLGSGRMYGLIAEVDDLPAGAIIFGRERDESHSDCWEVVSLYLLPEQAGKGIGSRLLTGAEALMAEEGLTDCSLWSIEGNRGADRFYRKHGFTPTGERIPYRIGSSDVTDLRYIRRK